MFERKNGSYWFYLVNIVLILFSIVGDVFVAVKRIFKNWDKKLSAIAYFILWHKQHIVKNIFSGQVRDPKNENMYRLELLGIRKRIFITSMFVHEKSLPISRYSNLKNTMHGHVTSTDQNYDSFLENNRCYWLREIF